MHSNRFDLRFDPPDGDVDLQIQSADGHTLLVELKSPAFDEDQERRIFSEWLRMMADLAHDLELPDDEVDDDFDDEDGPESWGKFPISF